jgi:hypothetical protein
MKEKKQIDKLFQEHFRNFEATPPPEAWANIKAQLQEKKEDRKVIPLWWKLGGVAALLALLLTIGNTVFDTTDNGTQLTEENTSTPVDNTKDKTPPVFTNNDVVDSEIANENDSELVGLEETDQEVISNDKSKDAILNRKKTVENTVANENVSDKKKQTSTKDLILKNKAVNAVGIEKEAISEVGTSNSNKSDNKTSVNKEADKIATKDVVSKTASKVQNTEIISDPLIKKGTDVFSDPSKEKEGIAVEIDATDKTEKTNPADVTEATAENKKSIFDAIEESKTEEAVVKNTVPDRRWEVSPNVGPVYYSSFGNGSSIDPSFADNSKSGDVNLSYGAAVSYAITEKLSVRTGINNVNLSYTTGGLELGTGPVSSALKSIDYGGRQNVTTAVDKGTLQNPIGNPDGSPFSGLIPKAGGSDAFINQSITYYEVPMELKYALVNNKFGVNMIGGFSTLFLGNNEVSVNAGDFSSVLGAANNLNSLSFTTNIGLGFDYKFSKKLKFNIEPMFKYQLNPYSDTSVDFNPFYMGVYTGLSFKF